MPVNRIRRVVVRQRTCWALALVCALMAALVLPAGANAAALKEGARGPVVTQLQRKLHVAADGVFGPQTTRAVRRFQRRHHLTVDGIVGERTAHALGISLAEVHSAEGVHVPAALQRIAACESGGNPRAVSADGTYRGKYQFDRDTWRAIGGHGDPAKASESEQDRRAVALYRKRGTAPWAGCVS
jgi:Transglycosylase-like domain/Putative peptidoglycan binding domain